jgi:hypothetical protein
MWNFAGNGRPNLIGMQGGYALLLVVRTHAGWRSAVSPDGITAVVDPARAQVGPCQAEQRELALAAGRRARAQASRLALPPTAAAPALNRSTGSPTRPEVDIPPRPLDHPSNACYAQTKHRTAVPCAGSNVRTPCLSIAWGPICFRFRGLPNMAVRSGVT